MPAYGNDVAALINTETGDEIQPGTTVEDFRGEPVTFLYVSRLPEPGKSGKVMTDRRPGGEFYPGVLNARIEIRGAREGGPTE
jgi:hypothetical protein